MTAVLASPTARRAPFRPPARTPTDGNGPFATSWEASSAPSVVERTLLDVTLPVAEPVVAEEVAPSLNPIAELTKFVLTQWMAAFVTYEVMAATIDRKGRYLPTVGL